MRMLLGVWLRNSEIARFENAVTSVSAIDITSAVLRLDVTASAEQIPRICTAIGLLTNIGEIRISRVLDIRIALRGSC